MWLSVAVCRAQYCARLGVLFGRGVWNAWVSRVSYWLTKSTTSRFSPEMPFVPKLGARCIKLRYDWRIEKQEASALCITPTKGWKCAPAAALSLPLGVSHPPTLDLFQVATTYQRLQLHKSTHKSKTADRFFSGNCNPGAYVLLLSTMSTLLNGLKRRRFVLALDYGTTYTGMSYRPTKLIRKLSDPSQRSGICHTRVRRPANRSDHPAR